MDLALAMIHTAAVQRVLFRGPAIQLGPMFLAARLGLKRVVLALALIHTAVQRVFSRGPAIQVGPVKVKVVATKTKTISLSLGATTLLCIPSPRYKSRHNALSLTLPPEKEP